MNSSDSSMKNILQIYSLINIISVGLEHSYRNFAVCIYEKCLERGSTRTGKPFTKPRILFPRPFARACVFGLRRHLRNQLI